MVKYTYMLSYYWGYARVDLVFGKHRNKASKGKYNDVFIT
jgi:hypothetical protein